MQASAFVVLAGHKIESNFLVRRVAKERRGGGGGVCGTRWGINTVISSTRKLPVAFARFAAPRLFSNWWTAATYLQCIADQIKMIGYEGSLAPWVHYPYLFAANRIPYRHRCYSRRITRTHTQTPKMIALVQAEACNSSGLLVESSQGMDPSRILPESRS